MVKFYENNSSDYQGVLFKNTNGEYVFASRGTEKSSLCDLSADFQMAVGQNQQMADARQFLQQAKQQIMSDGGSLANLSLTGHSLGGSITQVLAGENPSLRATTFNAYGVSNIVSGGDYSNLTNHVLSTDPVSVLPGSKMVGETLMYQDPSFGSLNSLSAHGIGNFLNSVVALQWGKPISIDVTQQLNVLGTVATLMMGSSAGLQFQLNSLITSLKGQFGKAEVTKSPIILDLNGDGVTTTSVSAGTHFDLDGNGFAEQTGWVGQGDGLLVLDRNGNGVIDDGSELFGNNTNLASGGKAANGFDALADMDSNHDGQVNSLDANFSQLRVWKDRNSDGITDAGELLTLQEAGVANLATGYTSGSMSNIVASDGGSGFSGPQDTRIDPDMQGNEHKQHGSYRRLDGTSTASQMDDVWFVADNARTIDKNIIEVSSAIAALPELEAFGNVHSLRQAMARDTTGALQALVMQFGQTTDSASRKGMMNELIYRWAGVNDVDPVSRGATMIYGNVIGDARRLATLEKFLGEGYLGTWCWGTRDPNPHGRAAPILIKAFDQLVDYMYSQLMMQTIYKPVLDSLTLDFSATGEITLGVGNVVTYFQTKYMADAQTGLHELNEFATALKQTGTFGDSVLAQLKAQGNAQGDLFERILAKVDVPDITQLTAGYGTAGVDNIFGTAGNDVLVGGKSADGLFGDSGDDIYAWQKGDGNDIIIDWAFQNGGNDTLRLTDANANDVRLSRDQNSLYVTILSTGERITIQSYFLGNDYKVENIQFADGTMWHTDTLDAAAFKSSLVLLSATTRPCCSMAMRPHSASASSK